MAKLYFRNRYLEKIREERLVNGVYHVECQKIIAKIRDNSLKIKLCHVDRHATV